MRIFDPQHTSFSILPSELKLSIKEIEETTHGIPVQGHIDMTVLLIDFKYMVTDRRRYHQG